MALLIKCELNTIITRPAARRICRGTLRLPGPGGREAVLASSPGRGREGGARRRLEQHLPEMTDGRSLGCPLRFISVHSWAAPSRSQPWPLRWAGLAWGGHGPPRAQGSAILCPGGSGVALGVGHWADGRGRLSWPPPRFSRHPCRGSPVMPGQRQKRTKLAFLSPQPFPLKDEALPGHTHTPQVMSVPWGIGGPGQASLASRHLPSPGEALSGLLRSPWQGRVAP